MCLCLLLFCCHSPLDQVAREGGDTRRIQVPGMAQIKVFMSRKLCGGGLFWTCSFAQLTVHAHRVECCLRCSRPRSESTKHPRIKIQLHRCRNLVERVLRASTLFADRGCIVRYSSDHDLVLTTITFPGRHQTFTSPLPEMLHPLAVHATPLILLSYQARSTCKVHHMLNAHVAALRRHRCL